MNTIALILGWTVIVATLAAFVIRSIDFIFRFIVACIMSRRWKGEDREQRRRRLEEELIEFRKGGGL